MLAAAIPLLCAATPVFSQENPWFFGLRTRSNHVLTNDLLYFADMAINVLIAHATDGKYAPLDFLLYNYHYVRLRDNGEDVDFKENNPYGFTSYDLFNDIEAGIYLGDTD